MSEQIDKSVLDNAWRAVENAQHVRRYHRRRTQKNSSQRKTDIEVALKRLKEVMKPIKSARGRFPYEPQTEQAERLREKIVDVSEAIQRERRKLWKMKTKEA